MGKRRRRPAPPRTRGSMTSSTTSSIPCTSFMCVHSFMCSFRLRSRPFASRNSWLLVEHVHVIGRAIRACLHVAPYLMREAIGGHRRQSVPASTWHRTSSVEG